MVGQRDPSTWTAKAATSTKHSQRGAAKENTERKGTKYLLRLSVSYHTGSSFLKDGSFVYVYLSVRAANLNCPAVRGLQTYLVWGEYGDRVNQSPRTFLSLPEGKKEKKESNTVRSS